MSAHRHHKFSTGQLACAYGSSRQHMCNVIQNYGVEIAANPDSLFAELVKSGRRSHLRQKLSDPQARAQAAAALKTMGVMDALLVQYAKLRATLPCYK